MTLRSDESKTIKTGSIETVDSMRAIDVKHVRALVRLKSASIRTYLRDISQALASWVQYLWTNFAKYSFFYFCTKTTGISVRAAVKHSVWFVVYDQQVYMETGQTCNVKIISHKCALEMKKVLSIKPKIDHVLRNKNCSSLNSFN